MWQFLLIFLISLLVCATTEEYFEYKEKESYYNYKSNVKDKEDK